MRLDDPSGPGDGAEHGGPVRRAAGAVGRVLEAGRTKKAPRRVLLGVTILMLLGGAWLLAYPFATNMFAGYKQGRLAEEFSSDSIRRAYVTHTVPVGHALTRLQIPSLGVDTIVVQGTTISALRAGSGHYPNTALPCTPGNASIAGHRTTYSKPFNGLATMKPGDLIHVSTPIGSCTYEVSRDPWVTNPFDWSIVRKLPGSWLTLTTCDPPGWATHRLVVRAKLVGSSLTSRPSATESKAQSSTG